MAAGKTPQDFKINLGKWKKKVGARLQAVARQTVQEMAKQVVLATPVDLGFLRASWQPSVGDDAESIIVGKFGTPQSPDPSGAMALTKIAAIVPQIKTGDVFHMRNGAVYAMRIEYGFVGEDSLGRYYNQQGQFYVTGTVKKWPKIVEQVIKDLKVGDGG